MAHEPKFYIAAIGASAGGQQPLHSFFEQVPPHSGIAFIVVTHLNRDYVSIANELLAKHTRMPVCWATHNQQVMPNHIYMLPVNKIMTIDKGYLLLRDRQIELRSNWAVDIFFESLANDQQACAIGIILSGAGSDGTLGAIAIHNEQGLIMVQDPRTAEFTSMPRSAILKSHPAQVLSPERLAQALLSFVAGSP